MSIVVKKKKEKKVFIKTNYIINLFIISCLKK